MFSLQSVILLREVNFPSETQVTAPWFWHRQPEWLLVKGGPPQPLVSSSSGVGGCSWSGYKHWVCNTRWLSQHRARAGATPKPFFLQHQKCLYSLSTCSLTNIYWATPKSALRWKSVRSRDGRAPCHLRALLVFSRSVMSNLLWPHGLQPTRLLCLWNSPGNNTGVGCMPSSRGSFRSRDRTYVSYVSCIDRRILYH